jgi:cytochrome c
MTKTLLTAALLIAAQLGAQTPQTARVLVFSKTAGYRHSSIEPGLAAIRKLGAENAFAVDATEDATAFTDRNLRRYRAVIWLSTTGDVLNAAQQDAFERYIQAGGAWVGIHAATDTEYEWPWYGRLAGAYFTSHPNNPNVRRGTFRVRDSAHVSTRGLPARWEREDEFYNFKSISPAIRVLVDIDESSYQGGSNGANHPMSWYHEYDGGRAWYTNMGHTDAPSPSPCSCVTCSAAFAGPPVDGRWTTAAPARRRTGSPKSSSRRPSRSRPSSRCSPTSACSSSSGAATSSCTCRG